jgi:hypothetical protein
MHPIAIIDDRGVMTDGLCIAAPFDPQTGIACVGRIKVETGADDDSVLFLSALGQFVIFSIQLPPEEWLAKFERLSDTYICSGDAAHDLLRSLMNAADWITIEALTALRASANAGELLIKQRGEPWRK